MLFDDMLFNSKDTEVQRSHSCENSVGIMGWPMGICILLTGIVAIVAILACIMFVICVKFATMADEEEAANKDSTKRVADEESVAYGAPVASNDIASQCDTDERAELIKVMLADENDT
ncbi:hypothetical protein CAEBREN_10822 [Caenorhabditis brenneri]|uniref:Uncharacterized protein n=1 Tax=Caenorhabditis brenneri TaxID=135651 RepID=G0MIG5_CAEBE|nr:hypothetical protein CAEBREN_10822 [Caenorhabditis brenneri]